MTRILSCLTAALLASAVSAQCFEPNFGTLMPRGAFAPGIGDDVLFDVQSMGLTFPMGGLAASYDSVHVQSNGVCFLTNALAASGAVTTGYSSSVATMTTNLRGTVTQPPRIAAYWRDLNIQAANSAGVYINNTIAGKCVVTWDNCVHFGQTSPVFTLQAQLFDTGAVSIFYSGSVQNTSNSPMCGVSQGAAVADPGAVDLSVGSVGVSTSLIAYQVFSTLNTFDLQTTSVSFAPNGNGGYDVTPSACLPATHTAYGAGCYGPQGNQAVYQNFLDGAAAGTALNGTSFTLTPTANGYTMSNGGSVYVVPSPTATVLTLGDDASVAYTPSVPFPHVAGPVTDLEIHSNSFVSMGPGNSNNAYGSVSLLLNSPMASFRMNMDLNPAIGGAVKVEEVGAVVYVTWEDVPRFGFPGAPERMQMQLDLSSGVVTYLFDMLTIGVAIGDTVVGYAPGPSVDPGAINLATQLPVTTFPDVPNLTAMTLAAAPTPVSTGSTGTTVIYTTANIPEAGPATGLYVSATILSIGQDVVGMDLAAIGAPGCRSYLSSNDVFLPVMFGGPSDTSTFNVPVGVPAGVQFFAQSVALVIPNSLPGGFNAGGVLTSNGIASVINIF